MSGTATHPTPLLPCETPGRHRIRGERAWSEAIEQLFALASRRLELLVPKLDPLRFDRRELQQILRHRIAGHRRLRIRILLAEADEALRHGHRLVDLAREFPSFVTIRALEEALRETVDAAFLLVDACCCLQRRPPENPVGVLRCDAPGEVRRLRARFDALWEQAETPPDLRRLHL